MQTFFYVGKIVFPFSLNRQEICKKQKWVLVRKYVCSDKRRLNFRPFDGWRLIFRNESLSKVVEMLNFHKIAIKFLLKSVLEDPKTWITFPQNGYSLLWSFRRISCSCVLKEIKNCVERNCIVCNFRAISAMESQKSGRENQNKET